MDEDGLEEVLHHHAQVADLLLDLNFARVAIGLKSGCAHVVLGLHERFELLAGASLSHSGLLGVHLHVVLLLRLRQLHDHVDDGRRELHR